MRYLWEMPAEVVDGLGHFEPTLHRPPTVAGERLGRP